MSAETSVEIIPSGTLDLLSESAAVTRDIELKSAFSFQPITLAAGAGPYTVMITLDRTEVPPVDGAFVRLLLNFPASTNPTVEVYDDTEGGTLLQTISGSAGAKVFLSEHIFDNGVWGKYDGRLQG